MNTKKNEDYIHCFHLYVYKKVIYLAMIFIIATSMFIFRFDLERFWKVIMNKQEEWITYSYNDMDLITFNGNARITNIEGTIVYEGMITNGKCNGKGTIFNSEGKKIYMGQLVDNVMEDEQGTLFYEDESIAYIGGIKKNQKNGEGTLYGTNGKVTYKGNFLNDHYEGKGIHYDNDGYIAYEGDFVDGNYHGTGILYEEGNSTYKKYEGSFILGEPSGLGSLYDTFGKIYYQGEMVEGYINYSAYLPSTWKDIEEHFLYPGKLYIHNDTVAYVIEQSRLMFILDDTCKVVKDEKEWKIDEQVKKEDVQIQKVILIGADIYNPQIVFHQDEIHAAWEDTTYPTQEVARLTSIDFLSLVVSEDAQYASRKVDVETIAHGNQIFEIRQNFEDFKQVESFPYERLTFTYGYISDKKTPLYSMMEERIEEAIRK